MYKAVITNLKNIRPHPDADRVQLATCWGSQVVVGLDHVEEELGVYFPSDGQLSHEFTSKNNLYRKSEMNEDTTKQGYFEENRRVRAQTFRGTISDGMWLPIESVLRMQKNPTKHSWKHGDEVSEVDGILICQKYISPETLKQQAKQKEGAKKKAKTSSRMFKKHYSTDHFVRALPGLDLSEVVTITEKLHGTSARTAFIKIDEESGEHSWWENIFLKIGLPVKAKWIYVNGSRRVDLFPKKKNKFTQFHDPNLRDRAGDVFKDLLYKGETVFYEIVGHEPSGKFIMGSGENKSVSKEFAKKWGNKTQWTYGNKSKEHSIFVYRITMTNEDGKVAEYSWEAVKQRCEDWGIDHVPELWRGRLDEISENYEDVYEYIKKEYSEGKSEVTDEHIKEGVCIRYRDKSMKLKSDQFKILEDRSKDKGIDMEEAS